jgi:fructan beta-fructosidase
MTLPRELRLHKEGTDYTIRSLPANEVSTLINSTVALDQKKYTGSTVIADHKGKNLYKIDVTFQKPTKGKVCLQFANDVNEKLLVGYDVDQKKYYIDRNLAGAKDFDENFAGIHTAPVSYSNETIEMTIYLDVSSVELFADDGRIVMTDIMFPRSPYTSISIVTDGTEASLLKGSISELGRAWK